MLIITANLFYNSFLIFIALDIWSVGVIMLEAMSRCFPFFSAENDSTCLAEMITVFGDRAIKNVAKMLGKY